MLQLTIRWIGVLAALVCLMRDQTALAQRATSLSAARDGMIAIVRQQGVNDPRVLKALAATPRHLFVLRSQRPLAWHDMALPIGEGQTISPPFVVGTMTHHLDPQPDDKVLEVGTGSGYQAAVLSLLVKDVYSIEIVKSLGERAARTLGKIGYENVHTKIGDGFQGWQEHAPFDKIIVTCSPEEVPLPLIEQLREGGRMVVPLGERFQQTLYLFKKVNGKLETEALQPTYFVPMTGRAEELRKIKNDNGIPNIVNGGFEATAFEALPDGWYYIRHGKVADDEAAPAGARVLTFSNNVPGRWAQALQAVAVDGSQVDEIDVTLWVRGKNIHAPQTRGDAIQGTLSFFDEDQRPAGERKITLIDGDYDWRKRTIRFKVPTNARLCVVALGLCGSTGEISFDGVEITVVTSDNEPPSNP